MGGEAEGGRRSVCWVEAEGVLGMFFEAEGGRCSVCGRLGGRG